VGIRNKNNMKEWGLLSLWWNLKKHTKFEACNFVTYKEVNPPNKKKITRVEDQYLLVCFRITLPRVLRI
jgi:hypothetical protein